MDPSSTSLWTGKPRHPSLLKMSFPGLLFARRQPSPSTNETTDQPYDALIAFPID